MSSATTTTLQLSSYDLLETPPSDVHFLPCKIDYEGPAPVDKYFLVEPLEKREPGTADPDLLVANFRGRRLLGRKEAIPSEAYGVIVAADYEFDDESQSDKDSGSVDEYLNGFGDEGSNSRRILRVEGMFKEITHWQQDQAPSGEHHVPKLLEFVKLARVLHSTE